MGNHQQTIELNGKHYDVITGRVIGRPVATPKPGVSIQVHQAREGTHPKQPPAHNMHAKPAHAQTLMRSGVHRPHISAAVLAVEKPVDVLPARRTIDEWRLDRAKKVHTSELVSRFGTVTPKISSLEVKPAPVHYKHYKEHSNTAEHAIQASSVVQTPATVAVRTNSKPKNHFEAQLEHATAHTAKPIKKPRLHHRAAAKLHVKPGTMSTALVILTFVILGGYYTYLNSSVIAVRAAAARAGMAVTMPTRTPAGFHLQSHLVKPGSIMLSYKSNLDNRSFTVSQTTTGDSQELLQNIVGDQSHQTIYSKGREVLVYGDNSASWVDKGKVFTLAGNAGLSSAQLQQFIDSM